MTSIGAPVFEARGASRTFTEHGGGAPVHAVRGVSATIHPGEFVVVAGPSGSGKTTFLHLPAAVDAPGAGEILIEGQPVALSLAMPRRRFACSESACSFP